MRILFALTLAGTVLAGCAGIGPRTAGDPAVQRLVTEDDQVRITELRTRGQTQRVTVDPKDSAAPRYEISQAAGGSDPSKGRDGAGQRVWTLLSF